MYDDDIYDEDDDYEDTDHGDVLVPHLHPQVVVLVEDDFLHLALAGLVPGGVRG